MIHSNTIKIKPTHQKLIMQTATKLTLCFPALNLTTYTKSNSVVSINRSLSQTKSIIQNDLWKGSCFFDSENETDKFSDYTFAFNASGTVAAIKCSATTNGTWISWNKISQPKFVLDFNGASPFDEIEDGWQLISQTNSEMKLIDISADNDDTKYLTFSKI